MAEMFQKMEAKTPGYFTQVQIALYRHETVDDAILDKRAAIEEPHTFWWTPLKDHAVNQFYKQCLDGKRPYNRSQHAQDAPNISSVYTDNNVGYREELETDENEQIAHRDIR
nr:hypothetical protein [Tanacetum cinerariifolium]